MRNCLDGTASQPEFIYDSKNWRAHNNNLFERAPFLPRTDNNNGLEMLKASWCKIDAARLSLAISLHLTAVARLQLRYAHQHAITRSPPNQIIFINKFSTQFLADCERTRANGQWDSIKFHLLQVVTLFPSTLLVERNCNFVQLIPNLFNAAFFHRIRFKCPMAANERQRCELFSAANRSAD